MKRAVISALLLTLGGLAQASEWEMAFEDFDEHFLLEIDGASMVLDANGVIGVWTRSTYSGEPRRLPTGAQYRRSVSRDFIDCTNRRLAIGEVTYFDDADQRHVVHSGSAPARLVWHETPPDTPLEGEVNAACSKLKPHQEPSPPPIKAEKV